MGIVVVTHPYALTLVVLCCEMTLFPCSPQRLGGGVGDGCGLVSEGRLRLG